MEQSILKSTKKILGVGDDDPTFDLDIITHINSAFSTLTDLGVGPIVGFAIEGVEPVWANFLTGNIVQINRVKTYIFLKTRLAFDPPTSSYLLGSLEKQILEAEWRLNTTREATAWVDPDPGAGLRYPDAEPAVAPPVLDGGEI